MIFFKFDQAKELPRDLLFLYLYFISRCRMPNAWRKDHIHNTLFSLQLRNRPNKLECCATLGCIGLLLSNTQADWGHL
jgi:hypothetical protein